MHAWWQRRSYDERTDFDILFWIRKITALCTNTFEWLNNEKHFIFSILYHLEAERVGESPELQISESVKTIFLLLFRSSEFVWPISVNTSASIRSARFHFDFFRLFVCDDN